jgi:hypothetical protein
VHRVKRLNEDSGINGIIGLGFGSFDAEQAKVEDAFDVTAVFVGIAMGVEFFLNIGAFGPFPEEFFAFGFFAAAFEGEPFVFESEALSAEVAAAQGAEVGAKTGETVEFGVGVVAVEFGE